MTKPLPQDNRVIFDPKTITPPPQRGAWKRMLPLCYLCCLVFWLGRKSGGGWRPTVWRSI